MRPRRFRHLKRALVGLTAAMLLTTMLSEPAVAAPKPSPTAASTAPSGPEHAGSDPSNSDRREPSRGPQEQERAALAEAAATGHRVEVTSRRTETGQVFANPRGTFTLEQYARPVRVNRGGTWQPVDTAQGRDPIRLAPIRVVTQWTADLLEHEVE